MHEPVTSLDACTLFSHGGFVLENGVGRLSGAVLSGAFD
jgi:hypothetical protein